MSNWMLDRLHQELLEGPELSRQVLRVFRRLPKPVLIRCRPDGADRAIARALALAVSGRESEIVSEIVLERENPGG